MLNVCLFTGRFAAEPKLFDANGVPRCVFTLAIDRDQKREDGEYDTDFLDFICWRGTAEFVSKYFHKGDLATVTNARAQVHIYEVDGVQQRKVEFLLDTNGRIYFGQSKRSQEE